MEIKIPLNLNHEEIKCFNDLVKPQLEELYSYNYNNFELEYIKIFISKDKFPDNIKKPNIEEIKNILNKIPKNDLKFILFHIPAKMITTKNSREEPCQ